MDTTAYSVEEIGRYISARVPSVINPSDPVRFRFAVPVDTTQTSDILTFKPARKGRLYWEDASTLAFVPDDYWQPSKTYQVQINLAAIISDVDPQMNRVTFEFSVRPVRMSVLFEPLAPEYDGDDPVYVLRGRINTSIPTDSAAISKLLLVKTTGKVSSPVWMRSDGLSHEFIYQEVFPGAKLEFSWDGKSIGSDVTGSKTIQAPESNELIVMSFEPGLDQDRKINIYFSQKLHPTQDINGLVTLNGSTDGFTVRKLDHILSVYPSDQLNGAMTIQLHSGIKSSRGYELGRLHELNVSLDDQLPDLKLVGSGVITPGKSGVIFPFEAINLRGVVVEVVRIFENNILQFLQNNQLQDVWDLEAVGRVIFQKDIDLQQMAGRDNQYVWTRYALDLSQLVNLAPGSIYQVRIGFKPEDTYLDCYNDIPVNKVKPALGEMQTIWRYNYYYDNFSWSHYDDPCYPAYYSPEHFISRNILASDIGLTAKQSDQGKLWVYAGSINAASPMSGLTIEVYDYQQQLLVKGTTSTEGVATFDLPRKAFFVVASSGQQKGYLRMSDGLALSLSEFDAGGVTYQEGLRGFIYGERDIWRPGDSVHLNFVLWDPENKVDSRHPIKLTVTNPLGQKVVDVTSSISIGGIYNLACKTGATDPTGNWIARVTVGDAVFSKILKIETVKPNRLRIDFDLPDAIVSNQGGQPLVLASSWLYGAPASNLRANVEAQYTPLPFSPAGFKDFTFTDPARSTPGTVISIFDNKLNDQGQATVVLPAIKDYWPEGQLSVSLKTRVFEAGGDFSTDRHSTIFHPYNHYAGISIPANRWGYEELKMNEANVIRLASVTTAGKGAAGRKLSVGIYNARWHWWWDKTGNEITQYNSQLHFGALETHNVTTGSDGTARFNITPSKYGVYLVRVCDTESGHCAGQMYYAGSWGDPTDASSAASRLSFSTDKESYEPGHTVNINVPSASNSKLLVTVEKNNKVMWSKWYSTTGDMTRVSFEATAEMMPNVYVYISHIQPFEHDGNDMPLRMYGVLPVMVSDPATRIHPQVQVPDVLAPDQNFTITVSERDKQPMAYTLAVVDEGLLGLTRFKTPDPWSYFHRKEALSLQTWDMYDQVMGGYGGLIERMLSLGGDDVAALVDAPQAERFKPVVTHLGPFYLNAGETKTHTIQMPNYVGAVRTMVVASDRKRWGSAEKTSTVKSDLMVLSTLPRVVSPGETVVLPVQVFAMSDQVRSADVTVNTNSMATVSNGNRQSIQFAGQGDKLTYFTLNIPDRPGLLKVDVMAKSGSLTASQSIELDVRIPNPPVTEVVAATIAPGQTWTGNVPQPGMEGTNVSAIELAHMPSVNLQQRLEYLIQYPYGCLEQTVSGVFPQLYLPILTDLNPQQEREVRRNVQEGIQRLKKFTLRSGGFSYWPGENSRDSWTNSYAGHFLIEAQRAGYVVDQSMLDAWRKVQKNDAQAYRPGDYYRGDLQQAYRLYTLAIDGEPAWGMMNRLRVQKELDPTAAWMLAAAYAVGGRKDAAAELIQKLSTEVKPYQELAHTYGSELRDKSVILETFLAMGRTNDAMMVARSLATGLSSDTWYGTQSTAFALSAIGKMASQFTGKDMQAVITPVGQSPVQIQSTKPLVVRNLVEATRKLTVDNKSSDPLYIRITTTGRPKAGASKDISDNLSMKVIYRDLSGKELNPASLKQGQDFVMQVTVNNPGTFTSQLEQMALSVLVPSGWELTNQRLDQFEDRYKNSPARYVDFRDDRANVFFNMNKGEWTYNFVLTAAYAGRYWLPDVYCEAMYSHQVQARVAGRWIEVEKG